MGGPARRVGCPVAVRGGRGARPARETDVRRNEMITSGPVVYTLTPRTTPPAGTRTAARPLLSRDRNLAHPTRHSTARMWDER